MLTSTFCLFAILMVSVRCGQEEERAEQSEQQKTPMLQKDTEQAVPTGLIGIANPSFEKDAKGWVGDNAIIKRVRVSRLAPDGNYALECASQGKLWDRVLYGCERANVCDNEALPARPGVVYRVSVWVKGVSNYNGVSVVLQVIGDDGKPLGNPKKADLSRKWQEIRIDVRTRPDTRFLGVQIVKNENEKRTVFLVDNLRIESFSK